MQLSDGAFGLVNSEHLDEGKSFAAVRVAVIYHFHGLHLADTVEEFGEVALGGFVAQISDMEAGASDSIGIGRGALARLPGCAGRAVFPGGAVAAFRTGSGFRRGGLGGRAGFGAGFLLPAEEAKGQERSDFLEQVGCSAARRRMSRPRSTGSQSR